MSFGAAVNAAAATTPDAPEMMTPPSSASKSTRCSSYIGGAHYGHSGHSLLCTDECLEDSNTPDGTISPDGCCDEAAAIGETSSLPAPDYGAVPAFEIIKMDWGSQQSSPRQAGQPCTPASHNTAAAEVETPAASCQPSSGGCLHYHRNVPPEHRVLIVGWMRQVCEALGLHASTLFMATSLLDRFMAASQFPPPEGILQLVALASMSVAVKFNEALQVKPSVWLGLAINSTGSNLYQPCDLQRCEFTLLQTIDWRLNQPTTHTFLEHFLVSQRMPLRRQMQVDSSCSDDSCGAGHQVHSPTSLASVAPALRGSLHDDTNTSEFCEPAVATVAAALAELSLLYDTFLSHEYCTVAQACIMLAQRLVAQDGIARRIVVKSPLEPLEPGLAACIEALELCCSSGEWHSYAPAAAGAWRT
ncbi:hypothetical protein Vretimale_2061 [Volvox reticuliferus]|uniref:Uncharacterized protein n=2 Tax=Volvox reticuliferus TaxID=1737510 RepID=A0A8J4G2N2_9CHLO|nr:hypothetical protein Vretifemale_4391 [Volvox reticuliferus]GIL96270.1 hypothetical protein Vretimale_2061 [Volvox reticuliferus]